MRKLASVLVSSLLGAVLCALLSAAAFAVGALLDGTAARPLASGMQIAMGAVCLIFLILCVKSFIDARRARKAE